MRILVISPHPDDETLGCGATLLKHRQNGDKLSWLIVTEMYQPKWAKEAVQRKASIIKQVAEAYVFEQCYELHMPPSELDMIPIQQIIGQMQNVIESARPDVVYLVHRGDIHTDHRIVFEATLSAAKAFSKHHNIQKIVCYEVLSSTDQAPPFSEYSFQPNIFCDVTPYMKRKIEIMRLYEDEVHPYPLPRSEDAILALAKLRGATIGVEYAEAFMLVRGIS